MKPRVSDLTAILVAILGFTCWVLGDSCIKWIGQFGLPPQEVVAFMGFFMALTLMLHPAVRRNLGLLRPHSMVRQGLRSLLDMANNVCVVIALSHLSLTMFYILIFTAPLVISILSAVFLGERITAKKALALIGGICGVVIAVAPWRGGQRIDLIGLGSCLVCVTCFSVNMIWSRVLTRTETAESLAFCSGVVTAICRLGAHQLSFPATHCHALAGAGNDGRVLRGRRAQFLFRGEAHLAEQRLAVPLHAADHRRVDLLRCLAPEAWPSHAGG